MSRTNESSRSVTLSSTRQMLDELDALMERMLALPVSDVNDEVSVPVDAFKRHAQEQSELYAPHEEAAPATIPFYRTEPDEPCERQPAAAPAAVNWKLEPPPALDDIAAPASQRAPLPELDDYPPPPLSMRRLLMAPLWLINGIYDGCTWLLGPVGRWLRGANGRGLLGFLGLVFLLLAAAWLALDWFGWTNWMAWNW